MILLFGWLIGCTEELETTAVNQKNRPDQLVEQSFEQSFRAGEHAGRSQDLEQIVATSHQLRGDNRANFLDGAAHTYRWDRTLSAEQIARQIEALIPRPHRNVFHDGVAISLVERGNGVSEKVMPDVLRYQQTSHQVLYNGVRIGFWRLFRHDPAKGLRLATEYPVEYHRPLMEELGWLLGSKYIGSPSEGAAEWEPRSLPKSACALLHGMVRGWWMKHLSRPNANLQVLIDETRQLSQCPAMVWRGVGWGIVLIHGTNSPEWKDSLSGLTTQEQEYVRSMNSVPDFWSMPSR